MVRRYFSVLGLVCVLAASLAAQNTTTFGNIVSQGTPCGASNCVYYQLPPGTPWVAVTVTGTWAGTIEIAATPAPNANYSNLSTLSWTPLGTTTANGTWSASATGATYLRARATTWASGLATVTMAARPPGTTGLLVNQMFPGTLTATGLEAPSGGSSANCWTTDGGSGACTGTSPSTNNVVNVCTYAGADLGAKIVAADTAWLGTAAELDVSQLCGTTQSTVFTLNADHNLKFVQGGTYTMLAGNVQRSGSRVSGIGPQVVLELANNQTGAMFNMADSTTACSGCGVEDLTMDGNQANAPSTCSSSTYNCAFGVFLNSNATAGPDHIWIENITFQNWYGQPVWVYEGGTTGSPNPKANWVWIENNIFINITKQAVWSYGFGAHMHIRNNTFSGWDAAATGNFDAIYWADTLTTSCGGNTSLTQDWQITGNSFFNTSGTTKFATELYGGVLTCSSTDGLIYGHNFHDGGGFAGGVGISLGGAHAAISDNVWKNCTSGSDRCGIESWFSYATISGNTMDVGAIQVYPSSVQPVLTDVAVTGNHLRNNADAGVGVAPILVSTGGGTTTTHVEVTGNTLDNTLSACTNNDPDIAVVANPGGTTSHINIVGNTLTVCNGAAGDGIRVESSGGGTASNVAITANTIVGAGASSGNGVLDSGTGTTDSDIRIHGNHFRSVTSPINIALNATQWDEWGNDTSGTSQGFESANGYYVGGTQIVTNTGVVLPRAASSPSAYYYGVFSGIGSVTLGQFTAPSTMILTQLEYSLTTAPSACGTAPYAELLDQTLGQVVAGSMVNAVGTTGSTGAVALLLMAGHVYRPLFNVPSTCSTYPAQPQIEMQIANTANDLITSGFFSIGTTGYFAPFTSAGETLTLEEAMLQQAPSGCSVNPTLALYDATAAGTVAGTTVTLTAQVNTSGTISVATTSGHNYEWAFTAGSGCGTSASGVQLMTHSSSPQPAAPVTRWGQYYHGSASNGTTYTFGSFTPQSALFVSSIAASLETNFATCSPNPTVDIYDATASAVVAGTTVTLTGQRTWATNLAGSLTAGHQYQMQINGGTGCGTLPANVYVSASYNVSAGNLGQGNNLADVPNPAAALGNLGLLRGTISLTTATSDSATIAGVTASSYCVAFASNATAAAATTIPYISAVSTNTVTISHVATTANGGTMDILCTAN